MTHHEIVFEEPPPRKRRGAPAVWANHLAPLRSRPGEWAVVRTGTTGSVSGTVNQLRSGRIGAGLNPDEWEFTGRYCGGEGKLYARFIGADQ